MKRIFALGLTVLGLAIGACDNSDGKKPESTPTSGGGTTPKTLKLAFVTNNASDFWKYAEAGCKKADAELDNVTVEFKIPADGSAATQKRIIEDLLATGVNGIAISPKDPANQTAILNEAASRGLVVTQDSDAPQSNRSFYIGTNNVEAGKMAGAMIKEALPEGGKIMVFVGTLDAQNARDRLEGIKQALAGSNITIADTRTDETDRVRAKNNVKDAITSQPDVKCMVGLWSYNGPAIAGAIKDAGKQGAIKAVVFDEEAETLSAVKDGTIYATIVQQPYEFGYQSVKRMAQYLGGDKSFVPESKAIIVPTVAVKQAGVDEFSANLKKLRGE